MKEKKLKGAESTGSNINHDPTPTKPDHQNDSDKETNSKVAQVSRIKQWLNKSHLNDVLIDDWERSAVIPNKSLLERLR